jgi:hypothetical protein
VRIHGLVSLYHQIRNRDWFAMIEARHADAERNCVLPVFAVDCTNTLIKPAYHCGLAVSVGLHGKYSKLISSVASDHVGVPKRPLENLRGTLQCLIAFGMAEGIVDAAQSIQVDEEQKHAAAGPVPQFQLAFRKSLKGAPVIETGKFIREREVAQFSLEPVMFCGTANRALQQVAAPSAGSFAWEPALLLCADIPK